LLLNSYALASWIRGANKELFVTTIADGTPRRAYTRAECCLWDDASLPDSANQFVLADSSTTVPNEVKEKVEHLRFHRDDLTASAQLMQPEIDLKIAEAELQIPSLCPDAGSARNDNG
jgi:hypothetical protein